MGTEKGGIYVIVLGLFGSEIKGCSRSGVYLSEGKGKGKKWMFWWVNLLQSDHLENQEGDRKVLILWNLGK